MFPLLATVLLTAAPANSPQLLSASVKKTQAFEDWRDGRFLFDERWVELPQQGLHVSYFLAPNWVSPGSGAPPFDDAFFVVDMRTGKLVAPAVVRSTPPSNGCPDPGEVAQLSAEPVSATSAEVRFGNGAELCALRLRRTKDAWTLSVFPDETRSPEANFPKAALAMAKVLGAGNGGAGTLQWFYLHDSRWLLAVPQEHCAVWVVDSITGEMDETASESMTQKICGCVQEVIGDTQGLELDQVARSLSVTGPGTAIPTCDCTFAKAGEADVECNSYAGRPYSPGMLAMMEEENPGSMERAADASYLKRVEEEVHAYRDLLAANNDALDRWRGGNQEAAIAAWAELYRTWVIRGRPAEQDAFGEMAEEIASLRGRKVDERHASIDLWAEILNNLGFALWSGKEWSQAEAAFDECMSLLQRTGRERNVLHLNRGDLYRDIGNIPAAKEAYERFLAGGVTAGQRKYVERELLKLEKRSRP